MTLNLIPTPAPSPADQLSAALPELGRLAELADDEADDTTGDESLGWYNAARHLIEADAAIGQATEFRAARLRIADEIADGDRSHHEP